MHLVLGLKLTSISYHTLACTHTNAVNRGSAIRADNIPAVVNPGVARCTGVVGSTGTDEAGELILASSLDTRGVYAEVDPLITERSSVTLRAHTPADEKGRQ